MANEAKTEQPVETQPAKARPNALRTHVLPDGNEAPFVRALQLGDRVMCVPKGTEPGNQFVALVVAENAEGFTLAVFHGGGRTWPQFKVSPVSGEPRGKHASYWLPLASGLR